MKYPGKEAYYFPTGPSNLSPCIDPYFRSSEYQAKKEQWMHETGITAGSTTRRDYEHEEKPDESEEEENDN
jgi:hypothetical protein